MRKKNTNEQLHTQPQFRLKPVYAAVLLAVVVQTAQANPIGGTVAAGQASFATTGNTLNVTNTPGTIINWQGFSIGANEITHFAQHSASSAVLNRVVSSNPSSILGTLQSNGRVFLINPGGIVFGAGAVVDVAGLVASTLNLSNADFLAGRNHFTQVPGSANVSNAGHITAHGDGQGNGLNGGQIYLIAPDVENTGVITAPNGEILLAAGYSVDLVSTTNHNLRVSITAPAGDATNVGQLIAQSGSLGLFGTVVRNSVTVSADSATLQGGKIVFKASQRTEISGTVSANGTTGGTIEALGTQVSLVDSATVTANGTQGGGTVLVGGDAHGANSNVQNATNTFVASTAQIHADATQNGNGGKVVVWADNATQFNGSISAQGGALSGNGGWVEVSGKQRLGYAGLTDTRAANGLTGSLLLDPTDITISTAATTSTLALTNTTGTYADTTTATSNLNNTDLHNQLALSNVTVDTTSALTGAGNITVQNAIAWNSPYSLTLNATGNGAIVTNAGATINNLGYGGLTMQTANGSITTGAAIPLAGGAFTANAGGVANNITINAPINTGINTGIYYGVSAINLTAGNAITQNVGGTLTANSINLSAQGTIAFSDAVNAGNGSIYMTAGGMTLADGMTFNLGAGTLNFISATPSISPVTGSATLTMSGGSINQSASSQTLTLGTGLTVNGYGSFSPYYYSSGNSIVNNGTIDASVAGQTLSVNSSYYGNTLTNNGTMSASAGTLSIAPTTFITTTHSVPQATGGVLTIAPNAANPWSNLGTINLAAGTLNLGGTFNAAGLGTLNRTAGTTVNRTGTLDNTTGPATVDIGSAGLFGGVSHTGGLTSLSGTITGGTVISGDGTALASSGGTLDNVTIGSDLSMNLTGSESGGSVYIANNLTLANGITLNLGNTTLDFNT